MKSSVEYRLSGEAMTVASYRVDTSIKLNVIKLAGLYTLYVHAIAICAFLFVEAEKRVWSNPIARFSRRVNHCYCHLY